MDNKVKVVTDSPCLFQEQHSAEDRYMTRPGINKRWTISTVSDLGFQDKRECVQVVISTTIPSH